MPLIQPEKKITNEQLHVTLPSDALQDLRAYCEFLNNSSPAYVVTQLIATLDRDKDFQRWRSARDAKPPTASPAKPTRGDF